MVAKADLHHPRPLDATLSVTRAAEVLGVHANTVRAWSDAGRLRYYRINPRGDRRYRHGDLQRFLAGLDGALQSSGSDDGRLAPQRRRGVNGTEVVPLADHEAMLRLVGDLSALSASAIRDAVASPGEPLVAALQTIQESLGALHTSAWQIEAWSSCRPRSACSEGPSPMERVSWNRTGKRSWSRQWAVARSA
jgi:excisionase family DNA binding protein